MKIKGLHNFINDLNDPKATTSPEDRIQLELLKIKKSFLKKKRSMYSTKKCVAKLCYIELYGECHVTFGFQQIQALLQSRDLADNFFGWLSTVILVGNDPALVKELIPDMRRFLTNLTNDYGICFALNAIGSIENSELVESIGPSIADIVILPNISEFAKKKAILTLTKIYQNSHQYPAIDRITPKMPNLLNYSMKSFGIRQCAASLALALIESSQTATVIGGIYPIVIDQLVSIFIRDEYDKETKRNSIPCPFLASKLFKILRTKPDWNDNEVNSIESVIIILLDHFLNDKQTENVNYCALMVLYEISDLAATAPFNDSVLQRIISTLHNLLLSFSSNNNENINNNNDNNNNVKNNNLSVYKTFCFVKVFALEKLTFIIHSIPHCAASIQSALPSLFEMIRSRDPSIDCRALNLLYAIANNENGLLIVGQLMDYLPESPLYLRESMCLKAAVLVQSYEDDDLACVSTLIRIMQTGDKLCDDKIWRSIIQTIGRKPELQIQVTEDVYDLTRNKIKPTDTIIKLFSFLIGEYAEICEIKISEACKLLLKLFEGANDQSQSMISTSLLKLASKSSEMKPKILEFFKTQSGSPYHEVSQRCKEYSKILSFPETIYSKIIISSQSNTHLVSDIFSQKVEIADQNESKPKDVSELMVLGQFETNDTGVLVTKQNYFVIRAAVRYEQPRLNMIINIENLQTNKSLSIKDFNIKSNDELRFRIGDVPSTIDPASRTSIAIDFVMMDITDQLPTLTVKIEDEEVSTMLPVFFKRWMTKFDIDKEAFFVRWASITDEQLSGTVQLMIPDGDVMKAISNIMRQYLGLEPLDFDLPPFNIVSAGAFKCFNVNIGVLLRFVYVEENMDLTLHIKANVKSAIKVIGDIIHKAFLS